MGGTPEMLARVASAIRHAPGGRGTYATPPTVSSDGRYVYFQLTERGRTPEFVAGVADLREQVIDLVPGVYAHNATWLV